MDTSLELWAEWCEWCEWITMGWYSCEQHAQLEQRETELTAMGYKLRRMQYK